MVTAPKRARKPRTVEHDQALLAHVDAAFAVGFERAELVEIYNAAGASTPDRPELVARYALAFAAIVVRAAGGLDEAAVTLDGWATATDAESVKPAQAALAERAPQHNCSFWERHDRWLARRREHEAAMANDPCGADPETIRRLLDEEFGAETTVATDARHADDAARAALDGARAAWGFLRSARDVTDADGAGHWLSESATSAGHVASIAARTNPEATRALLRQRFDAVTSRRAA